MISLIKESITLPAMFGITADVEEKRNSLVLASAAIKTVATAQDQAMAVNAARNIRTWLKEVEAARVALTKPLLDTQRQLKALADDHCQPLLEEQRRVERLVTSFQESEQRRVRAEEQARAEAIAKAERERIAAEELAREAYDNLQTQEQLNQAIAVEDEAKAATAVSDAIIAAPLPEVNKAKGAATRRVMRWEVTDINALVKARPDLCKIEAKASAIQAVCVPEMPNPPPGLRLYWENQTSIRSY